MKNMKLILILSCLASIHCYSQGFTVVYETYSRYSEEMIEAMPYMAADANKYRYSLHVNSQSSIFRRDSLIVGKPYDQNHVQIWQFEEIYKNRQTDLWLKTSGAYSDGFGYQRKISELTLNTSFEWKKTGKEKEILGFKCAEVSDRGKTAYYAVDIPVPDGPQYGIFGLPGLVLEYEDESGFWVAVDINFEKIPNILQPKVEFTPNESAIKMTVFDLKDLPPNKVIRIDYTTPINQWMKFDGR